MNTKSATPTTHTNHNRVNLAPDYNSKELQQRQQQQQQQQHSIGSKAKPRIQQKDKETTHTATHHIPGNYEINIEHRSPTTHTANVL